MIFNIFDNTTELMAKFLVSPVEQLCSNILILQEPLPLNKQCLPIPSRSSDLPLDLLVQWQHKENGSQEKSMISDKSQYYYLSFFLFYFGKWPPPIKSTLCALC